MVEPREGIVTFLASDIEGSTRLWVQDHERMRADLARHDKIMRSTIDAHGGYVFSTGGDSFWASFPYARRALEAVLAAQRCLWSEESSGASRVRVRMALHTGEAELRAGNYHGPPLNRLSRILSAGHGRQVLLSRATRDMVLEYLEAGESLKDLGEHRLEDLEHPEHIYQLVVPDLPESFPPLRTLDTIKADRYRLLRQLGAGGMGQVYLAHDDKGLNRDVALKTLHPLYKGNEEFVERFKREAQSAAALSHPNIVSIYDWGETKDGPYIVMEYLPGGTLKERILQQRGPFPPRNTVTITLQVAEALRAAHENGVIHRDIKPQNILFTKPGDVNVKVTDFGIAQVASLTPITRTDGVLGTPHYMSPEQAEGKRDVGLRSDLYSLGVVLYEMLAGRLPYDADTPIAIARKHSDEPLRPPRELNADIPEELNSVIVRLLAKNPDERYPNAAALIADLKRIDILSGENGEKIDAEKTIEGEPPTVQVPDLIGQTPPQARDTLANAGLTLGRQNTAATDTVPEGGIIEQDPAAWTETIQGNSVSLVVSSGQKISVPDLSGQSTAEAEHALLSAGLRVAGSRTKRSRKGAKTVISTDPPAGSKVDTGTAVTLTVSSGPRTFLWILAVAIIAALALVGAVFWVLRPIQVPELVGSTQDVAEQRAGDDFEIYVEEQQDSLNTEGEILRQDPEPGEWARQGTTISVVSSAGPEAVESAIRGYYRALNANEGTRIVRNSVAIDSLEVSEISDNTATAAVNVYFTVRGEGAKRCNSESWRLVKEGEEWKPESKLSSQACR